ncbi:MAG: xanthine dehydrogenase family protein molybdopterin-binding subunit, partial [Candidatus Acidiferrales bacterium]
MTDKVTAPTAAPKHTLVGQNYTTPDLLAKITGKAKYAEDYRADGMLFAKLLLSPYPHARVKHIDKSKALAMPGVKAIITVDDLPAPADTVTDLGAVNKADPLTERGLTNEPVYQGEPILAVAAVDELTAAEAIEKIHVEYEPLPFVIDPLDSLRPNGPNAREQGNVWGRPAPPPNAPPGPPPPLQRMVLKWTDADFAAAGEGELPMGKATDEWQIGNVDEQLKNAALVLDESFVTPNVSHQCLETRSTMAYWQNGKIYIHTGTQSTFQTGPAVARWLGVDPKDVVFISEYTGGGFGSKITGGVSLVIPALLSKRCNAPVMMRISREEEQYIGRGRPSLQGRLKVGFSKEGKVLAIDMFVICDNGPYEQMFDATSSGWIVSLL